MTDSKFCCPTCGHPILPHDPLAILTSTQRRIFDAVYSSGQAGIDSQALRERVYSSTTGGVSSQLIGAHISGINRKVRLLRMIVVSRKAGKYGALYTVRCVTTAIGEDARSTLTEVDVRKIRKDPRPVGRLAKIYGVNYRTIERIRKRETWVHVQ